MDALLSDSASEEDNATSLGALYTDFDQWAMKLRRVYSKRSHRKSNKEETRHESQNNAGKLNLHEFLIHGIFIEPPLKHSANTWNSDNEQTYFVSNDYYLNLMMRRKYMKSKL